jgi:hypothetical protein
MSIHVPTVMLQLENHFSSHEFYVLGLKFISNLFIKYKMSNQQHLYLGIAHLFHYLGTTNDVVPTSTLNGISNVTSFIQNKFLDNSPSTYVPAACMSSSNKASNDVSSPLSIGPASPPIPISISMHSSPDDRKLSIDSDLGVANHVMCHDLENSTNAVSVLGTLEDSRRLPIDAPHFDSTSVLSTVSNTSTNDSSPHSSTATTEKNNNINDAEPTKIVPRLLSKYRIVLHVA